MHTFDMTQKRSVTLKNFEKNRNKQSSHNDDNNKIVGVALPCPQCSQIVFCMMPCMFLRCVFRSSTNFKSGQWVHWIRLCVAILCAIKSSLLVNSSAHCLIVHLKVGGRGGRLVYTLRFFATLLFLKRQKIEILASITAKASKA